MVLQNTTDTNLHEEVPSVPFEKKYPTYWSRLDRVTAILSALEPWCGSYKILCRIFNERSRVFEDNLDLRGRWLVTGGSRFTREKEQNLLAIFSSIESSDRQKTSAREELLIYHLQFIRALARLLYIPNGSIEQSDLEQEWALGFFKGLKKYTTERIEDTNAQRSGTLIGYVWHDIFKAMRLYIKNHAANIRIPVHAQRYTYSWWEDLCETKWEISDSLIKYLQEEVANWEFHPLPEENSYTDLDTETEADDEEILYPYEPEHQEAFHDEGIHISEMIYASQEMQALGLDISLLPERQKRVIEARFWLNDKEEQTLQEIGNSMGFTREYIRQIEEKALSALGGMRSNK